MRKRLKLITMLIAGICCTSMLVGCGKSSQTSAEKDNKEVVVWSYLMDNEVEELDKIAQNDARIKFNFLNDRDDFNIR